MNPSSIFKIVIKFIICTPAPLAGACHHYKVMFYFRLSLHESDTFRGRGWDTEPAAAESRRNPLGKIRDNGVRGHRRRPLTSALRCQRRHPPLPAATTGRRSAGGLATLRARTGRYPHLEASVYLFNQSVLHTDSSSSSR